jgi:hypothetical protein
MTQDNLVSIQFLHYSLAFIDFVNLHVHAYIYICMLVT